MVWGCFYASLHFSMAQTSSKSFTFIDHPSFAKLAALGGVNITADGDPMMFTSNPALLDSSQMSLASFHYVNIPGDVNVATLGYNFSGKESGLFGFGLQYFNYGEFEGYDETGFPIGIFHANEFALSLGYGNKQGVFHYGSNLKIVGSVLESYSAYALVFDFGVNFVHPEMDLVLGVTAKNVGFTLSNYLEGQSLKIPTDIRLGGSYKPEHMPVRFHVACRNLLGESYFLVPSNFTSEKAGLADKLFRKMVFGAEIFPHENFHLRLGYNHLVRKEYQVPDGGSAGGFSGGLSFRLKKFELSYSHVMHHIAGGTNQFGVSTNINELRTF